MTKMKQFSSECYRDESTRICPYCDTMIETFFMRSRDPDCNQDVIICCPKCYQRIGSIWTNGIISYTRVPDLDELPPISSLTSNALPDKKTKKTRKKTTK
jgi:hypothetical protein